MRKEEFKGEGARQEAIAPERQSKQKSVTKGRERARARERRKKKRERGEPRVRAGGNEG